MKHADLVRLLESMGCLLIRHGGKHDWYQNPATKVSQPIPRRKEIADGLAPGVAAARVQTDRISPHPSGLLDLLLEGHPNRRADVHVE